MFSRPTHYTQNQATVMASKIIAKAVLDCGDHYRIVVVFALSTRQEFYWIFKARSRRSQRKYWKFVGYSPRDRATTFEAFAFADCRLHEGMPLSCKTLGKRALKALYAKTQHESIFSDWDYQPGIQKFDMMRKKLEAGRAGRRSYIFR